jgi:membrane dipeptidase
VTTAETTTLTSGVNASELHHSSLVVDALGPPLGPRVYNQSMLAQIDTMVGQGASYTEITRISNRQFDLELAAHTLSEYWDAWQCSGVDVNSVTVHGEGPNLFSYSGAIDGLARWQARIDRFQDRLLKVLSADDMYLAHKQGKHGVILGLQNSTHFGDNLALLEQLYQFGIRIIQLTYNSRNLIGDGCTERNPAGLSHFGVSAIRRMNDLGILIDVSHTSEPTTLDAVETTLDAVEVSRKPIALTHSFSRAIHDHDRGKPDEVLRAVGRDGFVGVALVLLRGSDTFVTDP